MPQIGIEVDGDLAFEAELTAKLARAPVEVMTVVRSSGQILRTKVVAHASGRPGPRRRTSDYVRSWTVITYSRGGDFVAEAGTNAPQGMRLEKGFTGTDALGRHYNQPAFPHAKPALDETAPIFYAALVKVVGL